MPIFGSYDTMDEAYKKKYDSDTDLSAEERKKIRYSQNPEATRRNIWRDKDAKSKLLRMLKSGWSGDTRGE